MVGGGARRVVVVEGNEKQGACFLKLRSAWASAWPVATSPSFSSHHRIFFSHPLSGIACLDLQWHQREAKAQRREEEVCQRSEVVRWKHPPKPDKVVDNDVLEPKRIRSLPKRFADGANDDEAMDVDKEGWPSRSRGGRLSGQC